MPNQSTPEIGELQRLALRRPDEMVFVEDAIQAVRDTKARVREEAEPLRARLAAYDLDHCRGLPEPEAAELARLRDEVRSYSQGNSRLHALVDSIGESARREAFREAVEALRVERRTWEKTPDVADPGAPMFGWAAQFIERTFLSPDNPEGNA